MKNRSAPHHGPHPCPAGCGHTAVAGQLMCDICWEKVPRDFKNEVSTTWETWHSNFGDLAALRAYEAARTAAVQVVSGVSA